MQERNWENLPAVMDLQETARFLGVGYRTVLRLAHRQGFPALRLGKKFLVNRDLLRVWLEREMGKQGR
ncbi:MAG: excisionase family DNA-binding protein [Syntrophothermus sp.]|uniref:helix-turn-helix domain-containing protein n=1 Tax=Syntrophothermus sp. TaxID=2736299 RepID=UPI00257CE2AA|nr:excisionase family DNA-binding protein [Syntrophothermus sp.]NSW84279.1 excisionase family DNA-binding protein [Syntrophothermus sp.]